VSILGGKLLARFLVGLTQLALLFLYGHVVFGLSLGSSPGALALVIAPVITSPVTPR
jgi:ABC-type Na+ efflux pump permease subunit